MLGHWVWISRLFFFAYLMVPELSSSKAVFPHPILSRMQHESGTWDKLATNPRSEEPPKAKRRKKKSNKNTRTDVKMVKVTLENGQEKSHKVKLIHSTLRIASEASYVYILSGQKFIKSTKNSQFWKPMFLVSIQWLKIPMDELILIWTYGYLILYWKQCYHTGQF